MTNTTPEEGLHITREQALLERRQAIVNDIEKFQKRRTWVLGIGVTLITVASIFIVTALKHSDESVAEKVDLLVGVISTIVYGFMPLILVWNYTTRLKTLRGELSDIENQLDLIRIPDQSQEQKAQKLLQIQQFELKKYYDQTLRQSNGIFWVGVITMILGFLVIAWSMYFVSRHFGTGPEGGQKWSGESVIVAVLGAIGGILTNFIGVMYIKMFSEIVQAVTKSHASLVITSHLHLANVLVANIRTDELREKTLAELVMAVTQGKVNVESH